MAQAYPKSQFVGFDLHEGSIEVAREKARAAGVSARCTFEVGSAKDFAGSGFDFITVFDALHDLGDPAGAARHILGKLSPGGTWMIVEPYAGDRVEENLNPIGRAYYAGSTLMCTPCSLSQEVGLALGAQAGEARLRDAHARQSGIRGATMKWAQPTFAGNGVGPRWRSGTDYRDWVSDIARQWRLAVRSPDCRTVRSVRRRPPGWTGSAGSAWRLP
jgi:SAM-dependent methyltransferase